MTKKYHWDYCPVKKFIYGMLILIFMVLCHAEQVRAADGRVTFDSGGDAWEIGEEASIGVSVEGDVPFIGYELYLKYDPATLQYVGGATSEENGLIYITGTGNETRYHTTLQFIPLQEGNTNISVIAANCAVGTESIDGMAAEVLNMTQMSGKPIAVKGEGSSRLATLTVSPVGIKDFAPDKVEYELTVPTDTERLQVRYTTETGDAIVTVPDTELEPGENVIQITVKGVADTTVYTLKVTREEALEEEALTEEVTTEEITTEEAMTEEVTTETVTTEEAVTEEVMIQQETTVTEPTSATPESDPERVEAPVENETEQEASMSVKVLSVVEVAVIFLTIGYGACSLILYERAKNKNGSMELTDKDVKIVDFGQKAIDVKNVTMKFRMASDEASSLKEYVIRSLKHQLKYRRFTALDNISFEVMQGEVIGIIGTNGSGKSTLLKIISGALIPTSGSVDVDRSKVQMLTLGTGFDMELTARENVYLNGAIIGYTKEYIDEKYDDIVKFAELEGFMEERMKNFSSGMVSRLGFAIATMRDAPDILILDEVLSVGDMFFRQKSEKRIREMIHSGATVLIVSHSMDTIMKNCERVVWIEKGKLMMVGDAKEVCGEYKKMNENST